MRMREWLDKRATYGNNPLWKPRPLKSQKKSGHSKKKDKSGRLAARSLFPLDLEADLRRAEAARKEEERNAVKSILDDNYSSSLELVRIEMSCTCSSIHI